MIDTRFIMMQIAKKTTQFGAALHKSSRQLLVWVTPTNGVKPAALRVPVTSYRAGQTAGHKTLIPRACARLARNED
jgi:hypothetical protein